MSLTRASREISIHAPREGSDGFLAADLCLVILISIHAPREGSDLNPSCIIFVGSHFYPRSPRGERQPMTDYQQMMAEFLSTLPARGATPQAGR